MGKGANHGATLEEGFQLASRCLLCDKVEEELEHLLI